MRKYFCFLPYLNLIIIMTIVIIIMPNSFSLYFSGFSCDGSKRHWFCFLRGGIRSVQGMRFVSFGSVVFFFCLLIIICFF